MLYAQPAQEVQELFQYLHHTNSVLEHSRSIFAFHLSFNPLCVERKLIHSGEGNFRLHSQALKNCGLNPEPSLLEPQVGLKVKSQGGTL